MRYEVWERMQLESSHGELAEMCYVIDTAIVLCKQLSIGNTIRKIWKFKPGGKRNPYGGMFGMMDGEYVDLIVDKAYALIERDQQSLVRGWGINGKYYERKDCGRCDNTGDDGSGVGLCTSCKGSSINPSL
jgi:hypothetical protein